MIDDDLRIESARLDALHLNNEFSFVQTIALMLNAECGVYIHPLADEVLKKTSPARRSQIARVSDGLTPAGTDYNSYVGFFDEIERRLRGGSYGR